MLANLLIKSYKIQKLMGKQINKNNIALNKNVLLWNNSYQIGAIKV